MWLVCGLALAWADLVWVGSPSPEKVPVFEAQDHASAAAGGTVVLIVQRAGDSLQVSWKRNSEALRDVDHAVLHITDGSHNSKLDLNVAELRAGKLVYWPESPEVTFRLELPAGEARSEARKPSRNSAELAIPAQAIPAVGAVARESSASQQRDLPPQQVNALEAKPSPFDPKPQVRLVDASPAPVSIRPMRPPVAQAEAQPRRGFFHRLARKIPLVRRLEMRPQSSE